MSDIAILTSESSCANDNEIETMPLFTIDSSDKLARVNQPLEHTEIKLLRSKNKENRQSIKQQKDDLFQVLNNETFEYSSSDMDVTYEYETSDDDEHLAPVLPTLKNKEVRRKITPMVSMPFVKKQIKSPNLVEIKEKPKEEFQQVTLNEDGSGSNKEDYRDDEVQNKLKRNSEAELMGDEKVKKSRKVRSTKHELYQHRKVIHSQIVKIIANESVVPYVRSFVQPGVAKVSYHDKTDKIQEFDSLNYSCDQGEAPVTEEQTFESNTFILCKANLSNVIDSLSLAQAETKILTIKVAAVLDSADKNSNPAFSHRDEVITLTQI